MKVEKILDKMADIIKEEQAKHEFSITSSHVFFMPAKIYHQIEKYYDLDMTDIRVLKFRDYTLLKFKGITNDFICFGEIHLV